MFVISVMSLPILATYICYDGMNFRAERSYVQMMSFGNMGFSGSQCIKNVVFEPNDTSTVNLTTSCERTTTIQNVTYVGLI